MKCKHGKTINNQASTLGLAHEHKCVHMIFKGASIKSKTNFCSCRQFVKKNPTIKGKIEPLNF